ncbi:zincin-like metallopeptidase domain-containing protein [Flavobacterium sp. AG291]|uniref:zincin-like metallopeptidase domain-containing protein n=1 Tax=Flavobacterium sp. AG291 TaxID=2184000 RepID=UPI000E0A1D5C|nr:zincin-like metallopeptidase domain-containing protein [Flavobacterium sp. AG291]RDI07035.1 antirestriction protein ArdC [Flavobacterium sp. AG291]
MSIVEKFNALNRKTVTRKELQQFITEGKIQEQPALIDRVQAVLAAYPDAKEFRLLISKPSVEVVPESLISCLDCEDDKDDIITGLGKAVSPNEIYQMMTDKMIQLIKQANSNDWKKPWEAQFYGNGYTLPFNFVTKKMYRGINRILLTGFRPLENPFFLTFKQVEELKGKIKKGTKGHEVVYFTKLYLYQDAAKKIDLSSYDREKFIALLKSKNLPTDNVEQFVLPILKYYKVFNGKDIEGIDFNLENFKHGFIDKPLPAMDEHRMPIAEAIIKKYPDPAPSLKLGGNTASYNSGSDILRMPYIQDFETVQGYYTTYFHELSHSTGHKNRLSRKLGNKFGSKDYAFEELIAEFGATFLSAESGIIFHTAKNSAAYLKGWNSALTFLQEDNRFLMRAATQAQAIADYILQYDSKGDPKYFLDIRKKDTPKKTKSKAKKKPVEKESVIEKKKDIDAHKKHLEAVNPISFSRKPKSASVTTAINEVLASGKYKVKPMQANVLYTVLKDVDDITAEDIEIKPSKFQKAIIQGIPDYMLWYYDIDDNSNYYVITLSDRGVEFVNAIRGRVESLKNQKYNYSMFDGLKGAETQQNEPEQNQITEVRKDPVQSEQEFKENTLTAVTTTRKKNPLVMGINESSNAAPADFFIINGETGKFFQRVERKPVGSVVITLDGEQGAGKTTALYKFMNDFATPGNSCLFISGEEHPLSSLATDKRDKYLSAAAQQNIDTVAEVENTAQLYELIADYDIIFIDSWQKLLRMVGPLKLDEDLRKKFNGKVFVIIFQQTTTGRTKGGAEVVFDGDIITKMVKESSFADNYAYFDKNRYTLVPLETIAYNIATGTVYNPEQGNNTDIPIQENEPQKEKVQLKFDVLC